MCIKAGKTIMQGYVLTPKSNNQNIGFVYYFRIENLSGSSIFVTWGDTGISITIANNGIYEFIGNPFFPFPDQTQLSIKFASGASTNVNLLTARAKNDE